MFEISSENKFVKWLMISSSDPSKASLMVKGILVGVIPFIIQFLPLVGIHLKFDISTIPDIIYSIVFGLLTAIASVMTVFGMVRKLYYTIFS